MDWIPWSGDEMMYAAIVTITLKKGVADPEGKNTAKALHLLGFSEVQEVQSARMFKITLDVGNKGEDEARSRVNDMCKRLLANPVIHDYTIDLRPI